MPTFAVNVSDTTFDREVLARSHETTVVVSFWAPWCAPCQMLGPALAEVVDRSGGRAVLAQVNADQNPALCLAYGVQGIPAVKAFRNGRIVGEFVGAQPPEVLETWLASFMPTPAQEAFEAIRRALAEGRTRDAEALLRSRLQENPTDSAALLALGRLRAAAGADAEAEALLARIPAAAPEAEGAAQERSLLAAGCAGRAAGGVAAAEARVAAAPADLDARWALAGAAVLARRPEQAIEELLEIIRRDRLFRDGVAHQALLALFGRLGREDPAVGPGQTKLAMLLFS